MKAKIESVKIKMSGQDFKNLKKELNDLFNELAGIIETHVGVDSKEGALYQLAKKHTSVIKFADMMEVTVLKNEDGLPF